MILIRHKIAKIMMLFEYGADSNRFGRQILEYRRHAYLQLIMDFGNGD